MTLSILKPVSPLMLNTCVLAFASSPRNTPKNSFTAFSLGKSSSILSSPDPDPSISIAFTAAWLLPSFLITLTATLTRTEHEPQPAAATGKERTLSEARTGATA